MNIAIMCNLVSDWAPERAELICSLMEKGHKVYMFGKKGLFVNQWFIDNDVPFITVPANRNNTNPLVEVKSLLNIRKQLKQHHIDAVIIYGVKNHSAMAIAAKLAGASRILCIVNGSGNLFRLEGAKGKLVRAIAFPALKFAYSLSNYVCFQNRDDKALFMKKRIIKKENKAFVTNGSGINLIHFLPLPLVEDDVFLYLSRITPSKGIFEYIAAAEMVKKDHPNCRFDIVGPLDDEVEGGRIREAIQEASDRGIISYHGATDDVASRIGECRYFVYPSYYPEGVPRSALQALACGRPIITCDSPGCKEIVRHEQNGYLVPPRNEEALAEAMREMLRQRHLAEEMGRRSRLLAEERFSVFDVNTQLIAKLLEEHE